MLTELKDYKLLRNDILIRNRKKVDVEKSIIYTKESIDDSALQYFEVLAVGPKVTQVKVGDVVIVNWKNITPPFESTFNGTVGEYGITDEDQVECILT
jgi:hypothetical protein